MLMQFCVLIGLVAVEPESPPVVKRSRHSRAFVHGDRVQFILETSAGTTKPVTGWVQWQAAGFVGVEDNAGYEFVVPADVVRLF